MTYYLLLRFVNGRGVVPWTITERTGSLFDHTELGVLANPTDWKSVTGWLGAHVGSGVKIRPLNYLKPTRDYRYAVPVSQDQYNAAMRYANRRVGTPYGKLTIVGLLLNSWRIRSMHREICSQLMYEVTEAAFLDALNVLPQFSYRVTPEGLHLSPIFRGRLVYKQG